MIKLVDNRRNSFIFILAIGIISLISLNVLAYSISNTKISTDNTEYKINNNEEVNVTYMVQLQDLSARYFGDSFWNGYNYVEDLRNITLDLNIPKGIQVKEIKLSQEETNENINIDGVNINSIKLPNVEYKLSGNWWDRYYSANPFKITIKYIVRI